MKHWKPIPDPIIAQNYNVAWLFFKTHEKHSMPTTYNRLKKLFTEIKFILNVFQDAANANSEVGNHLFPFRKLTAILLYLLKEKKKKLNIKLNFLFTIHYSPNECAMMHRYEIFKHSFQEILEKFPRT